MHKAQIFRLGPGASMDGLLPGHSRPQSEQLPISMAGKPCPYVPERLRWGIWMPAPSSSLCPHKRGCQRGEPTGRHSMVSFWVFLQHHCLPRSPQLIPVLQDLEQKLKEAFSKTCWVLIRFGKCEVQSLVDSGQILAKGKTGNLGDVRL